MKIVNVIVQARVIERRCMDCGEPLTIRFSYCHNGVCGGINTPTTYTSEEWTEAVKNSEAKLERRKK